MRLILNVIFGLKGLTLTQDETDFFHKLNPLGFILFKRNISDPQQVKDLVDSLKKIVDHDCCLILIDQEGGRVARLKPPHFRKALPAKIFGDIAAQDLQAAQDAVYINHLLIGRELKSLGINCDCAPVADLFNESAHSIIGDRSFSSDWGIVANLAIMADLGLRDAGVQSIIKHIPGHGRADADSHEELPVIRTPLAILEELDFKVFMALHNMKFAMTAHILFTYLDAQSPITISKLSIDYIKERLNFSGLIITDDLSMKALTGDIGHNAKSAVDAGCDILLHCNGDMLEMLDIAKHVIVLSDEQLDSVKQLNAFLQFAPFNKTLCDLPTEELEFILEKIIQKCIT